jgi:hypothetical protein
LPAVVCPEDLFGVVAPSISLSVSSIDLESNCELMYLKFTKN